MLIRDQLLARSGKIKPGGAVDFGKLPAPAGARRPLDLERVADQFCRIEIAAARECVHDLAAGLLNRGQCNKRSLGHKAGLFGELALCGGKEIGVGPGDAFGDRPCSLILARPERPARMRKQNLKRTVRLAIDQDAGADFSLARHHVTAAGAIASMSVTTSITTGRPCTVSARAKAAANSLARSTRSPTAPISSAMRAKLTLR